MKKYGKKMIAPIVVTILMLLYYLVYFGFIIYVIPGTILKALFTIIPLVLGGVMIYVCVERIREIKGGEEDDLSQY